MQPSRIPGYRDPSKAKSLETDTQEGGDEPPPPEEGKGKGSPGGSYSQATPRGRAGGDVAPTARPRCVYTAALPKSSSTQTMCVI